MPHIVYVIVIYVYISPCYMCIYYRDIYHVYTSRWFIQRIANYVYNMSRLAYYYSDEKDEKIIEGPMLASYTFKDIH